MYSCLLWPRQSACREMFTLSPRECMSTWERRPLQGGRYQPPWNPKLQLRCCRSRQHSSGVHHSTLLVVGRKFAIFSIPRSIGLWHRNRCCFRIQPSPCRTRSRTRCNHRSLPSPEAHQMDNRDNPKSFHFRFHLSCDNRPKPRRQDCTLRSPAAKMIRRAAAAYPD